MAGISSSSVYYKDQSPTTSSTTYRNVNKQEELLTTSNEDARFKNFINASVGVVSLVTENLLCHPFIVLRRQCQVHNNSFSYHITPVTLIPVICQLHKHQGISTLWKGVGSTLLIRGLSLGIEDLLSKVTPWPKELSTHSSVTSLFQHVLLKSITFAIIMPFYSASLVETVQSDIASEKPGILDVFREGMVRLLNWTGHFKGRMLPMWALVLPTITHCLVRYFVASVVKYIARCTMLRRRNKDTDCQDIELYSSLIGIMISDVVFYPVETIMHRLYLQGTRTIVDNLDTGKSVLPILSNYRGPPDCYEACLNTEGCLGFYKGFGALIMQYAVHVLLIRATRTLLTETRKIIGKPQQVTNSLPQMGGF